MTLKGNGSVVDNIVRCRRYRTHSRSSYDPEIRGRPVRG
jgi:hypothetical protein